MIYKGYGIGKEYVIRDADGKVCGTMCSLRLSKMLVDILVAAEKVLDAECVNVEP